MPDCPASDQSGTRTGKTNDAGNSPVPDQAKAVRHFFGPVPDEIIDAGMPMPALVSSMPMPSYTLYDIGCYILKCPARILVDH
jgi:hypothetical protein